MRGYVFNISISLRGRFRGCTESVSACMCCSRVFLLRCFDLVGGVDLYIRDCVYFAPRERFDGRVRVDYPGVW